MGSRLEARADGVRAVGMGQGMAQAVVLEVSRLRSPPTLTATQTPNDDVHGAHPRGRGAQWRC